VAQSDLTIQFEGKDINVVKMLKTITDGLNNLEKKSTETTKKFGDNLRNMNNAVIGMTGKLTGAFRSQIGMLMGMAGVGGFTAAIIKGIKAADDWEEKLASLSVMLGKDFKGSIEDVEKELNKLSKTTSFTMGELSTGFQKITKSGVKGTDELAGAMKVLDSAQKLAIATNSDLGSTVEGVTRIMTAFGIEAGKTEDITNKLLVAARKGKMDFNQLSGAMGYLGTTANQAGISFDDLLAATIGMQRAGVPARNSTLALSTVLQQIIKPTKAMAYNFNLLKTGYKDMAEMVKEKGLTGFFEAIKEMTGGDIEAIQKLIPSFRTLRGVAAMVGQGMGEMKKAAEDLKGSSGELEKAFETMMKTKEFEMFQKKVNGLLKDVGERLLPIVTKHMENFGKWIDENKAAISDTLTAFGDGLMTFLEFIVENAGTIIKVMAAVWAIEKVAGLTSSLQDLGKAFGSLKGAILAMNSPAVLKILSMLGIGISAATAGIVVGGISAGVATGYAALNLADPKNKRKPSEMLGEENAGDGIPILPGAEGAADHPMASMMAGELEGIMAANDAADAAISDATLKVVDLEKKRKVYSNEEIAAIKKAAEERKKSLEELHKMEIALLGEREQLIAKMDEEFKKASEMKGLKDVEKANYLAELTYKQESDLVKFDEDRAQKKAEYERKMQQDVEKAGEDYHEMRMAWREQEEKKAQEANAYLEELWKSKYTERQKLKIKFEEDLEKIRGMNWQGDQGKYQSAIKLRTDQYERETGGFFVSFKKMFTGDFWAGVATGFAEKVGAKLLDYAVAFADFLTTPLSALTDVFTSLMGGMGNIAGAGLGKITGIFNEILGGGKGVADVKTMTQSAVEFFKQLAQQLPAALAWFAKVGVPQIIKSFVESLPAVITAIVEAIPIIIDSIISNLDKIIMPFVEGMLTLIPALIQRIPDIIAAVIELIPQVMGAVIRAIPSMAGSLFTGALKILPNALLSFVKGIGKMIDAFTTKDRAETAQKAKSDIINEATAAGYSEEEAGALGEQIYEVVMGRGKDIKELADYYYDQAYTAEMKKSGDVEKAKAAGEKKRDEVIAFYKKLSPGLTDSSKPSSGPGMDQEQVGIDTSLANPNARPSAGREDSIKQTDKERELDKKTHPLEDPVRVATIAYEDKLKEMFDRIDSDWLTEKKFLKLQGMTPAQITKVEKTFRTDAKKDAYTAARAAYDAMFNEVTAANKLNPNYVPERLHSGGFINGAINLARAMRAHGGVSIPSGLAPDEVPIIAQTGEAVMNRRWVQNQGGKDSIDQMNRTGGSGGGMVNNVYVEHMMSNDTAKVIDGMISNNLRSGAGKLYEKLNTGRAVGYKTRRAS
jgi:TP901 family phage tail tape measure protein